MNQTNFKALLHQHSLKATATRVALLTKMDAYLNAMPYSAIQKEIGSVDRVTLYRTIETLSEHGIIHLAYKDNQETYYAICGAACSEHAHHHDHIHFSCTQCKSVTCQDLPNKINISLPDYQVEEISIQVKGICKDCRAGIVKSKK